LGILVVLDEIDKLGEDEDHLSSEFLEQMRWANLSTQR